MRLIKIFFFKDKEKQFYHFSKEKNEIKFKHRRRYIQIE